MDTTPSPSMNDNWLTLVLFVLSSVLSITLYYIAKNNKKIIYKLVEEVVIDIDKIKSSDNLLSKTELQLKVDEHNVNSLYRYDLFLWNAGRSHISPADFVNDKPLSLKIGLNNLNSMISGDITKKSDNNMSIDLDDNDIVDNKDAVIIPFRFNYIPKNHGAVLSFSSGAKLELENLSVDGIFLQKGTIKKWSEDITFVGRQLSRKFIGSLLWYSFVTLVCASMYFLLNLIPDQWLRTVCDQNYDYCFKELKEGMIIKYLYAVIILIRISGFDLFHIPLEDDSSVPLSLR